MWKNKIPLFLFEIVVVTSGMNKISVRVEKLGIEEQEDEIERSEEREGPEH